MLLREYIHLIIEAAHTKNEIGLMTREEFLSFINPDGKYHPSDAYDFELADLNRTLYPWAHSRDRNGGSHFTFYKVSNGSNLAIERNGKMIAVIQGNKLFVAHPFSEKDIKNISPPAFALDEINNIFRGIDSVQTLKYVEEKIPEISDIAKKNMQSFPILLQNIVAKGESFQIRAEDTLQEDKGITIAIINNRGEIVAQASDEWGATLITVAREYRERGLGTILAKVWYKYNPSYSSGGFTSSGEDNAIRRWEDRVREFLENGWYSKLIKDGELDIERVKEIISGLSEKRRSSDFETKKQDEKQNLVFIDDENVSFIIYDSRFLEEQNEDYIHAYGFFRDVSSVGTFLFRLDYDSEYRKAANIIALQMAKNEGEAIYVGEGYGDMMELDGIPHIEQDGDYVRLTEDLVNLSQLRQIEEMVRKPKDQYDELRVLLLEMAEGKWS